MQLNKEQLKAVHHIEGPLLILAGAGSGKTTVLSYRVENLLRNEASASEILCVTFTNKAANELKKRIIHITKNKGEDVWVSTFHALSRNLLDIYYKYQFQVAHTAQSRQIIKQIVDKDGEFAGDKDFLKPSNLMKVISLLKSELVTSDYLMNRTTLKEFIDQDKFKELVKEEVKTKENLGSLIRIYQRYQEELFKINKIDVDDMLLLAVRVLTENPVALKESQKRFKYIMIDEYQDANRAQYVLSKLLASKHKNITVVGDDFQSIYKFRGSDIRNILSFDKDYPDYLEIKLEENYRSTQTILEAANALISHNTEQKEKTLYPVHGIGEKIKVISAETSIDEGTDITKKINKLIEKGYQYRDIAVFYRSNAESGVLESVFPKENIPFIITKESSFFERKEIKDILSYLRFCQDSTNVMDFVGAVSVIKRGVGKTSIDKIVEGAKGKDITTYLYANHGLKLSQNTKTGIAEFLNEIEDIKKKAKVSALSETIIYSLKRIGYLNTFSNLDPHIKKEKVIYLKKLIEIAQETENSNPHIQISDFLDDLGGQEIEVDLTVGDDFNKVNLMTIHSSKGLEFPVVFIIGMREGGFPSQYATSNAAIEEERRLCYVAFTRAQKELYLSYPKTSLEKVDGVSEKLAVENLESRFLKEFPQELVERKKR